MRVSSSALRATAAAMLPLTTVRRIAAVTLVGATAIFVVVNLLHPKELGRGQEAEQLASIAAAHARWQAAHLLSYASILLFATAIIALTVILVLHRPKLALWAGGLGLTGLFGFAAALTLDGFTWGILGELSTRRGVDAKTVELALHEVQQSGWALPYYLSPVAWIAGLVCFAVALVKARLVPAFAGWLLAIGAALVAAEPAVGSNAYFVFAAVVLFAGASAVAVALLETPERRERRERRGRSSSYTSR